MLTRRMSSPVVIGLCLFLFLPAFAQDPTAPEPHKRLKIGVAFEGGGALGLAHIGVL